MTAFQRLAQFAAELRGTLLTAPSGGYEAARALFNRAVTTRPAVLVRCLGTQDVVRSIRFARENDLAVSVRAGGHHACGYCLKEGGLTLDLSQMKRIDFDPEARAVWVEPGCGSPDIPH